MAMPEVERGGLDEVFERDLRLIWRLILTGERKDFVEAVRIVNRYIAGDQRKTYLIVYLIEAAVPYNRIRKLVKLTKGVMGERWTNRDWVWLWFQAAVKLSKRPGVWYMDDKRLVRWIKKGRLDDQIVTMVGLAAARPEQVEFAGMVEGRLQELAKLDSLGKLDEVEASRLVRALALL